MLKKLKSLIKSILSVLSFWFGMFLFDPISLVYKLISLPSFFVHFFRYQKNNSNTSFRIKLRYVWYKSYDRFERAGTAKGHYFYQDIWAAQELYRRGIKRHVDIGSRVDGFIGHILPFCEVEYVDIRPIRTSIRNFKYTKGSILELPYSESSLPSVSCLHVIEHIGLGRYGDSVFPDGYKRAATELVRVVSQGGVLLLGVPVGRERLCFDAHRIFDPKTIIDIFNGLELIEFSLIDDKGRGIIKNASVDQAMTCQYGCGLFVFKKCR